MNAYPSCKMDAEQGENGVDMKIKIGDTVELPWRPQRSAVRVDPHMYEAVARLRSAAIVAAQRRSTITYGEAEAAIDRLFAAYGLGRALDLLSHDCIVRREPSLAALFVRRDTGEVGDGWTGDAANAAAERERCYEYWGR
jgi:hypothetical protein